MSVLSLHSPDERFRDAFLAAARDYVRAGEIKSIERYQPGLDDFPRYLRHLRDMAVGVGLQPDWVAMRYFWLIEDDARLVGVSRLRPRLTPALELQGGHIGYDVPPSARRKGYGTQLLRLTLPKAREAGLSRVLLTVDSDNAASIRIIENNGGRLEFEGDVGSFGRPIRRYTIDVGP